MHSKFVVLHNDAIEAAFEQNEHCWRSLGDDPQFEVMYGFSRAPFIVIALSSDDEAIDPRFYINRGRGYNESDSKEFGSAHRFIFILDVGHLGFIRSVRLDPASHPCSLRARFEAFSDRESADEWVASYCRKEIIDAKVIEVGKLPRFVFRLPDMSFRRKRRKMESYLDGCYALAGNAELPTFSINETPWLSIVVPVYNAPEQHLHDLLRSFEEQSVGGVELILSDDASTSPVTRKCLDRARKTSNVKVVSAAENGGIAVATNRGLELAAGEWITFLDHDDVIAPHALKLLANALAENPHAQFLYTDEVVVDEQLKPTGLMLKPAYDPILLTGVNYINHFSVYKRERLSDIGYLRQGFDGSQDYDLLLRYLEGVEESEVLHLPYPAYWWRRSARSFSRRFMDKATRAARTALADAFVRRGIAVEIEPALTETLHRVAFAEKADWPMISVIIPSRDSHGLILRILDDLFERTDYPNFEVMVIDNGTTDDAVLDLYDRLARERTNFRYFIEPASFNFSRAINRGIERARGEHFLVLNNDVEVIGPEWLKEMVSCLDFSNVGIVGAKLLYPNGRLQHAGVIVGFGGLAGHWYLNQSANFGGPMNRLHVRNTMTCVTGAVMLISGKCAREVGAWDENNFAVAYNDVDYCMRANNAGLRIVWTPFACLYHHESVSRGSDLLGERKRRFEREKENLRNIHQTEAFDDPTINPHYGKQQSSPTLRSYSHLAKIRARVRR